MRYERPVELGYVFIHRGNGYFAKLATEEFEREPAGWQCDCCLEYGGWVEGYLYKGGYMFVCAACWVQADSGPVPGILTGSWLE